MKRIFLSVLLVVSLCACALVVSNLTARHAYAGAVNVCTASGVLGFSPSLQLTRVQHENASLAPTTLNTCTDPDYTQAYVNANASGDSSCTQLSLSGLATIVWQEDPFSVSTASFTISTSLLHLNQFGINGKILAGPFSPGTITAVGVINPLDLVNCATSGTDQLTFTVAALVITGP